MYKVLTLSIATLSFLSVFCQDRKTIILSKSAEQPLTEMARDPEAVEFRLYNFRRGNIVPNINAVRFSKSVKKRGLDSLVICFSANAEELSAALMGQDLYLRLEDASKNPIQGGAINQIVKLGEEDIMVCAVEQYADNDGVCFSIVKANDQWEVGVYRIQIICNGESIGEYKFIVI